MKIEKKNIAKWVKALRSGKYKQTKRALQNKNGFCCLGVACVVFIKKEKRSKITYLLGIMPRHQTFAPEWLKYVNTDFAERTGLSLSNMNDDHRYSFSEIADILEAVYIYNELNTIYEDSVWLEANKKTYISWRC